MAGYTVYEIGQFSPQFGQNVKKFCPLWVKVMPHESGHSIVTKAGRLMSHS